MVVKKSKKCSVFIIIIIIIYLLFPFKDIAFKP